MINVSEQINSVHRNLGKRTLEAGEARVLTITRKYPTDIKDMWNACTDPERIARWFLPVSGDVSLGGRYQLEGNAGGIIERCDPPNSFAATWEFGGGISWIELRLTSESDDVTVFELDHIARVDEHWEQFGPGAVGIGWDMGILGLSLYISIGTAMNAEESAEWSMSEEARQFMTASGERWCAADIASGTDPEIARAAAQRTLDAYTAAE